MKIAIFGYGNLGKGIENAAIKHPDTELVGIFTRRDPSSVSSVTGAPVYAADRILAFKDQIDVLLIAGGSATDLPRMTPTLAENFNVVDSFDTHAAIDEHFARVDAAARKSGHLALISCGWDPGLFSLGRLYGQCILPDGENYTFWGPGVSQGHSDAIRRIPGVLDARQYTVPVPEALARVRGGEHVSLTARQKHTRECFVVAAPGADLARIESAIKTMPHYFDEYDTTVHFITQEELSQKHAGLPHGGVVIRNGATGYNQEHRQIAELQLTLSSNPEFTASVLVAYARAVAKKYARGERGCLTVFDVAPADLSMLSPEELRKLL